MRFTIARHFLSQFTKVKVISSYSPTAVKLAHQCKLSYPDGQGGIYDIRPFHIIREAQSLGLLTERVDGGVVLIGIDANDVKKQKKKLTIYDEVVCRHGFALMSLIELYGSSGPTSVHYCPRCKDGREIPTDTEVETARQYLLCKQNKDIPQAGALIMAARDLGYKVIKKIDGSFQIQKRKISDGLPKAVGGL
jgi:hypothetical protein